MKNLKTKGAIMDKLLYGTGCEYKGVHIPILELKSDNSNILELYNKYKRNIKGTK